MPKSRHRKNHKKKVAAFKRRQQEKKNGMMRQLREKFQEQFAQEVQGEVDKLKDDKTEETNG
jgi:hypothetical protein